MARQATGTVTYVPARRGEAQGHYRARVTCADGSRPWIDLEPSAKSPKSEARAREKAAAYAERIRERGIVSVPQLASKPVRLRSKAQSETVEAYSLRWLAERERRGLASIATDRGRVSNHVLPVIGHVPIKEVRGEDLRALVADLDAKVQAGTFGWKTAARSWGLVTKLFADACGSKVEALRVRDDNPAAGVRGPDRGERKAKQWLFPSEATALLGCDDVPLRWRRLYALAAYLYLRPGELAALEWSDVQDEHGYVSVHQALDMRTGKIKPTKTGITRKVPIPEALASLLVLMRAEASGGPVVQNEHPNKVSTHGFPPLEDLASSLRDHLARAGVTRADLFADRPGTKRITFYDLRATGITWEAIAGTEHLRIMQRAGHLNITTTLGYVREAESIGVSVGEPFPPLPDSLAPSIVPANRPSVPARELTSRSDSTKMASPTGFEPVLQP